MSDYFAGKHVVVTGAASGVGLALIEELLRRGAATAVMADYNEETLSLESERVARGHPGKVKAVVTDVTNA
ncbi:MAG: SDR family NAD(P)-dependent oxidoreductase, partial [Promicromonosporaceae bacterium]|nr:SDR family NAD(P)-dependent oxidoreductase [Promicromonosporaceae bacterium]